MVDLQLHHLSLNVFSIVSIFLMCGDDSLRWRWVTAGSDSVCFHRYLRPARSTPPRELLLENYFPLMLVHDYNLTLNFLTSTAHAAVACVGTLALNARAGLVVQRVLVVVVAEEESLPFVTICV